MALRKTEQAKHQLAGALGKGQVDGQLHLLVNQLLLDGYVDYTIPEKPHSRMQKYRLTAKGQGDVEQLQDRRTRM